MRFSTAESLLVCTGPTPLATAPFDVLSSLAVVDTVMYSLMFKVCRLTSGNINLTLIETTLFHPYLCYSVLMTRPTLYPTRILVFLTHPDVSTRHSKHTCICNRSPCLPGALDPTSSFSRWTSKHPLGLPPAQYALPNSQSRTRPKTHSSNTTPAFRRPAKQIGSQRIVDPEGQPAR